MRVPAFWLHVRHAVFASGVAVFLDSRRGVIIMWAEVRSMMRFFSCFILSIILTAQLAAGQAKIEPASPDPQFAPGAQLFADDFGGDLSNWKTELERGGDVWARKGRMEIDVPAGCTVWFKWKMTGPLMIQYQAQVISAGGKNDRVSDLNCFWMARDSRSPDDIFATARSGKFTDYDRLLTYYVGLGGNTNSTTRFRRYIGVQDNRPLLPENDLRDKPDLIVANNWQLIRLLACGGAIQYWRDEKRLFNYTDPQPYTSGWFGVRTTKNHMIVKDFRVWAMSAKP